MINEFIHHFYFRMQRESNDWIFWDGVTPTSKSRINRIRNIPISRRAPRVSFDERLAKIARLQRGTGGSRHSYPENDPSLSYNQLKSYSYKGTRALFPQLAKVFNAHQESRFVLDKAIQYENMIKKGFNTASSAADTLVGPDQVELEQKVGSILGTVFGGLTYLVTGNKGFMGSVARMVSNFPTIVRNAVLFSKALGLILGTKKNDFDISIREKIDAFADSNRLKLQSTVPVYDELFQENSPPQTKIPSLDVWLPDNPNNPNNPDKGEVVDYNPRTGQLTYYHNHPTKLSTVKRRYTKTPLIKKNLFK